MISTAKRWANGYLGLLLAAALPLAAGACGDSPQPPLRTLGPSDVADLPAGNATGTAFSGPYVISTTTITGCRCRAGSCNGWMGRGGATIDVATQDGTFISTEAGGVPCRGGINQDGTFTCGVLFEETDVRSYVLTEGKIQSTGGTPTTLHQEVNVTFIQSANGVVADCDLGVVQIMRFSGL